MSEDRDSDSGQFVSTADPAEGLFGREATEARAGFKSASVEAPRDDSLTVEDAAALLTASRDRIPETEVIKVFDKESGEPLNADLSKGPVEALTLDEAADLVTAKNREESNSAAKSISSDFAQMVDKMRADAIKDDPKAAEHYGVEIKPQEAQAPQQTADAAEIEADGALAPEVKKALQTPAIRQVIEQQIGEAHQVKQAATVALQSAHNFGQASILALAPELIQIPQEQWAEGINLIAQVDPQRGQQISDMLGYVGAIQQAQAQEQQQRTHRQQQEFKDYRTAEDAKFDVIVDKATQQKFAPKVPAYLESLGLTKTEVRALANDRTITSAAGQQVLLDAMRYREMMSASKPVPTRNLPPVIRPGAPADQRANSGLASLEREFNAATPGSAKQIKIAARMQAEKRRAQS
jgi:hypothetical protein